MGDNIKQRRQYHLEIGIVFGAGVGTTLGIVFGNMVMGTSIGAGLGLVLGAIVASRLKP